MTYNIEFVNKRGRQDETQLDVEDGYVELINLLFDLKEELCIERITNIYETKDEEDEEMFEKPWDYGKHFA